MAPRAGFHVRAALALTLTSAGAGAVAAACSTVHSTAIPTTSQVYPAHRGPVYVSATRDPEGGTEIGEVQAEGVATIEGVVPEFVARVAQLGGNYARIDRITTHFEIRLRPYYNNYRCGGLSAYRCGGSSFRQEEVATMRVTGRAFLVPEAAR